MSQEAVELFIGRAVTDEEFRKEVEMHLENACARIGLVLTVDEMNSIRRIDLKKIEELSIHISDKLKRYSLNRATKI